MCLFVDTFPAEALVGLAGVRPGQLARLVASGAIVVCEGGFRLAPAFRAFALATVRGTKEGRKDLAAHGRWLQDHVATMAAAADTNTAFDMMERVLPDVRSAALRLSPSHPTLAAELWCSVADLLFYRRLLPFDAPEYALSVGWADRARAADIRVRARLAAGRAAMEMMPREHAGTLFEEARALSREARLPDLEGDAVRGLGWVLLAGGDVAQAEVHFREARALHESTRNARGIADACMAQGVTCVLTADAAEAERLFFRAEALLRAKCDTARLAKLGSLRATLGIPDERLPHAELDVEQLLSRGQYWRAALALARAGDARSKERARVLADLAGVPWESFAQSVDEPPAPPREAAWTLRSDGARRVLVAPDGATKDLTRRGPLVRILDALAVAGAPQSAAALFAAAWPGESAGHEAAMYRVYTTVRRLRALGVPIATTGDGYFCDRIQRGS
jgi:hypothetical protein